MPTTTTTTPAPTAPTPTTGETPAFLQPGTVATRILELLRHYRGLPLTYADLEDELDLSRRHLRTAIGRLEHHELIRKHFDEEGTLHFSTNPD